jgi:amino acid transporter
MNRLLIPALPSLVNGIVFTSIFSTGSSFMFTSSRMLYTLACHGQAPKILRKTNRFGTPYLAVAVVVLVSCLSYLTLSSQAGVGESQNIKGEARADSSARLVHQHDNRLHIDDMDRYRTVCAPFL